MWQQGIPITVTTFPVLCAPCGFSGPNSIRRSNPSQAHLETIREVNALETPLRHRPSQGRVSSSQLSRPALTRSSTEHFGRTRRNSNPIELPPIRKLTLKEIIDEGPALSPWHKNSPYHLERKSTFLEECKRKEKEREEAREKRRASRQLDGSRSGSPSPGTSRANSFTFNKNGALQRTGTGSSINSEHSGQSSRSNKRTLLNRVETIEHHDRFTQGIEARKEQQLREPSTGADGDSDPASHRGQGQRGFFRKHPSKGAWYVTSHPCLLLMEWMDVN